MDRAKWRNLKRGTVFTLVLLLLMGIMPGPLRHLFGGEFSMYAKRKSMCPR